MPNANHGPPKSKDLPPINIHQMIVDIKPTSSSIHFKQKDIMRHLKFKNSTRNPNRLASTVEYVLGNGKVDNIQLQINKLNKEMKDGLIKVLIEECESINHNNWKTNYTTNWNNLPEKLKKKCLDFMSLKTRTRLGRTSKTEQRVLESHKFPFEYLKIDENALSCNRKVIEIAFRDDWNKEHCFRFRNRKHFIENGLSLMKFVLKIGNFHSLDFEIGDELMEDVIEMIEHHSIELQFKKYLNFTSEESRGVQYILKNCQEGVKQVLCDPKNCDEMELESLLQLPNVFNANRVVLWHIVFPMAALKLIDKWIEIDAKLGTTFDFEAIRQDAVDAIMNKFKDRIEYINEHREIRIKMNNPEKLVSIKHDPFYEVTFRCAVVTSLRPELPDFGVEKDSDSSSSSVNTDFSFDGEEEYPDESEEEHT